MMEREENPDVGIVLVVIVVSLISFSTLAAVPREASASSDYTPHDPIYIDGNDDFTAANGVTGGNGTLSNPFTIDGWEIDASLADGIEVRNTTDFFVIHRVFMHSGGFRHDGIALHNVTNGRVENSTVFNSLVGILLHSSIGIFINGNDLSNNFFGVEIKSSSMVTIGENDISNNTVGIFSDSSDNLTVVQNNINSNDGAGMRLISTSNVTTRDNSVLNNPYGFLLDSTINVWVTGNQFTLGGVHLDGDSLAHFNSHTITQDNLVNGKPLHYYRDCTGIQVAGIPVGQLIVANCTSVGVANLEIANAVVGIEMAFVEGAIITGNQIYASGIYGIFLRSSANVTVKDNDLSANNRASIYLHRTANLTITGNRVSNTQDGIALWFSRDISVAGNNIWDNRRGIFLYTSTNGTVANNSIVGSTAAVDLIGSTKVSVTSNYVSSNGRGIHVTVSNGITINGNRILSNLLEGILFATVSNASILENRILTNGYGISLSYSIGIHVYHNNIINNGVQAIDARGRENSWDDGYPSGGNYWSDYTGGDDCSGPNQDFCPDSDGIGDTPYTLGGIGQDNYPLVQPYNRPPVASFTLSSLKGNVITTFTVDGSSSWDLEDPTTVLEVRWDWEDDGVWDTPWSTDKIAEHRYAKTGTYMLRLEVRDTGGLNQTIIKQVTVVDSYTTLGPVSRAIIASVGVALTILLYTLFQKWRRISAERRGRPR